MGIWKMSMVWMILKMKDDDEDDIKLNLYSMISADFATFAVLVSFGVLLGKKPFIC